MRAAAHGGAYGVGQNTLNAGVLFLQVFHDAGVGAAAARTGDKVVNLPVQVAPDLRTRGLVVGQRVCRVVERPQ